MEIAAFLLFIIVCFGILTWSSMRSKTPRHPSASKRKSTAGASDKLYTPPDTVLSHRDELWKARREAAHGDVIPTNRFSLKSESSREPEYDGYSRRDRHHLTSDSTHVKEDGHADDVAMGALR